MAKKYMPFPIDLSTYTEVQVLTCCQYGILMRIISEFWKSGREIPKNEYHLYNSIRCPFKLWASSKVEVYRALHAVMPDVIEVRNRLALNKAKLSQNAVIARTALRISRKPKKTSFVDSSQATENITPIPPPDGSNWHHKGHFDMKERQKALQAKKDDTGKTFKD